MAWIRLKGHHGTGTLSIATGHGVVQRAMEDGIVEWPEDVAWPAGAQPSEPAPEVQAREHARQRDDARRLAESLGLRVVDPEAEPVPALEAAVLGAHDTPLTGALIVGTPPPLVAAPSKASHPKRAR